MPLNKFLILFSALLVLTACARTGDGIRDDSLVLAATKSASAKVFVGGLAKRNSPLHSGQLIHVTLNGVKVAELGINETVILDPLIGENVIKLQPFGYLTSPHDGASKTFTMKEGQKRFFISGNEIYSLYKGPEALRNWTRPRIAYRPIVAELRQAEFFAHLGIRTSASSY